MSPTETEILKQASIFSSLDDDELTKLTALITTRSFKPGEYIFWDGDEPDWLYTIAEGKVKIFKLSSAGKEFIIAFFGPGETFGEVAVFGNKPYPASAQAVSDTTVLGIRREDFVLYLTNHPQVALRIINMLGERLRDAQNRLRDFAGVRVEQRLAGILVMLSLKLGLTLPFTRQEIADMAGTTTETAIRVMSQLKERGIIKSTRGKVVITDELKLKLLSEGPPDV